MLDQLHSHLSTYLAHRGPRPPGPLPGPLIELKGGWASSLYTFTQQGTTTEQVSTTSVLKLYAPTGLGREHAEREWHALSQLRAAGYPVPQGILCEPDAGPLGSPFVVMDHVAGLSFWSAYEAADAGSQATLTKGFVQQLLALQALDPRILQPAPTPADPYSYLDHELALLRRDSESSPHTRLSQVIQWLGSAARSGDSYVTRPGWPTRS